MQTPLRHLLPLLPLLGACSIAGLDDESVAAELVEVSEREGAQIMRERIAVPDRPSHSGVEGCPEDGGTDPLHQNNDVGVEMNQLESAVDFINSQQDEDAKALLRHALKLAIVDMRHPSPSSFDLVHYLKLVLLMYEKRHPLEAALRGDGHALDWWGGE